MATVTITDFLPQWQFWRYIEGDDSGDPALIYETKTKFSFKVASTGDFANWTVTVGGTGFKYLANEAWHRQ